MIILATFPDLDRAREITRQLVEERLAACATLWPGVTSIYRWEGEVREEAEVQAVLKTTVEVEPRLMARLRELHPYDVPEILALPVTKGLPAYREWVAESCSPEKGLAEEKNGDRKAVGLR